MAAPLVSLFRVLTPPKNTLTATAHTDLPKPSLEMKKGGGNYRPSKNILKAKLAHANCLSKHTLFGSTLKGGG